MVPVGGGFARVARRKDDDSAAGGGVQPEGQQPYYRASLWHLAIRSEGNLAAGGGPRGKGRVAAIPAAGGAGQGGGIILCAQSGRNAGGAGQSRRCLGPAAAAVKRRALRESGLPGGGIPADRGVRCGWRERSSAR